MKKIAIIGLLSLCASGAYAQGQLSFYNNISGKVITHIYAPNGANPNVETTGNAANDYPVGAQNYTGFTAIGGSSGAAGTPINYANGNNFSVEVYALGVDATGYSGTATPFSSLLPVPQYVSTLTDSSSYAAGIFLYPGAPPNDPGIPNAGYNANTGNLDTTAAISVVAWYNAGGTINTFAQAMATPGIPYGNSPVYTLTSLGEPQSEQDIAGTGNPPSAPEDLSQGTSAAHTLQSFSLVANVPEPGTIALGLMGVCGFLARRRKA
jgi:hypothetical protein